VPDFEQKRATKIGEVVDARINQLEVFINNNLKKGDYSL
jgi:hypothetical protein